MCLNPTSPFGDSGRCLIDLLQNPEVIPVTFFFFFFLQQRQQLLPRRLEVILDVSPPPPHAPPCRQSITKLLFCLLSWFQIPLSSLGHISSRYLYACWNCLPVSLHFPPMCSQNHCKTQIWPYSSMFKAFSWLPIALRLNARILVVAIPFQVHSPSFPPCSVLQEADVYELYQWALLSSGFWFDLTNRSKGWRDTGRRSEWQTSIRLGYLFFMLSVLSLQGLYVLFVLQ